MEQTKGLTGFITRKPLLTIGIIIGVALLIVLYFYRQTKSVEANALAVQQAADSTLPAPQSPGYFEGSTPDLSDLPGYYGGGTAGVVAAGAGAQDTAPLSPNLNSSAGVDLGPPASSDPVSPGTNNNTSGGGPPVRPVALHSAPVPISSVAEKQSTNTGWQTRTIVINGKKEKIKVRNERKSSHPNPPAKKRRK